jgi:Thymidylate kinase
LSTLISGHIIDEYLRKKIELPDQAAHLLFSANRWEREPTLTKLIEQGITLICDRYSFSGVAFSAAKEVSFYFKII